MRAVPLRLMVIAPSVCTALASRSSSAGSGFSLHSWAKLPVELPEAGTWLLVDEAHYAQSLQAQRTQAFLGWRGIPACGLAWMLTGTPIRNGRPICSFSVAAMDHPIARDQKAFEEIFARGTGASATVSDAGALMVPAVWRSCVVSPAPGAAPPEAIGARSSGEDAHCTRSHWRRTRTEGWITACGQVEIIASGCWPARCALMPNPWQSSPPCA